MKTGANSIRSPEVPHEDPRIFLLEGGGIQWDGTVLVGIIGDLTLPIRGGRETMTQLEHEGRAISMGGGFWTCPTCPECGGTIGPDFTCCSETYA